MKLSRLILAIAGCLAAFASTTGHPRAAADPQRHLLYAAVPGIRNYVEYGGIGILVYDMDDGHRLLRRIPTFTLAPGEQPENIKGIAANAQTGRLYITTIKRVAAIDLATDRIVWNRTYEGGCDRLAISPDGKILYVPSLEGPHWHVLDAMTGDVLAKIETGSGAHNTIYGPDGSRVYLAGLKSPILSIADTRTHKVVGGVGPFASAIRPFTINGAQTLCFVNVNGLLGFEVGDIKTGKLLHHIEVAGFEKGPVKRHGCPSHGIALSPDEKELWLADGANSRLHIFDSTSMPPKKIASIGVRDQPGWITFSLDGRHVYPSTGEVIDAKTRQILTILQDEKGGTVQSEKVVEVVFNANKPVQTGDQFGIGRAR
jgi:DNA-binding beta-propeller fold protein YncE